MPVQDIPDHLKAPIVKRWIGEDRWVAATVEQGESLGPEQKPRIVMRGMTISTLEKVALELFQEARRRRRLEGKVKKVNRERREAAGRGIYDAF